MRDNITTFGRGETWYNGDTPDLNENFDHILGTTKVFEDNNYGDKGVKSFRSGQREVVCRLVRNKSGQTLYGKRLVVLDPTSPNHVLGYATTTAQECYPTDEFLTANGVPDGDLFWIVLKGPAIVATPMNGADFATASIAAGAVLVALTTAGASTGSGTTASAGRAAGFTIVAATTVAQITDILNYSQNAIGRAMSAVTSGQTNADLLIDIKRDRNGWP